MSDYSGMREMSDYSGMREIQVSRSECDRDVSEYEGGRGCEEL